MDVNYIQELLAMSQALYRKYRPRNWDEVVGQEHIVQTLRNAVVADRVGHAYLFAGPRGTGKTTLARLLAKAVNCLAEDRAKRPCNECENCRAVNENRFLDLVEIDAASNTGVDDVRDLREKINFAPSQGRFKIYIIDEVHMLSTAAFNALLKTLEEPPPHVVFVLATTEAHKIPATVLSRCQRHEFRRVALNDLVKQLKHIVAAERITMEDEALSLIARQASGSFRDAISLLDQLASAGTAITLQWTQTVLGTAASQTVLDLIASLRARDSARGLEIIHRALDSGAEARTLARQVVDYLRGLMLIQLGNPQHVEATREVQERMGREAASLPTPVVLRWTKIFNHAAVDTRGGWHPALSLELAFAEALEILSTPIPPSSDPAPAGAQKAVSTSPPSATQVAPTAHPPSSQATLENLVRAWKDVHAAIKPSQPALAALLNSCKPVELRGDELLLGFKSEVVRSLMDKPENLNATCRVIEKMFGVRLKIRCVVMSAQGKLPPDVPADGMVATALDYGGEIVDV